MICDSIISNNTFQSKCFYDDTTKNFYTDANTKTIISNNYEYSDIRAWLNTQFYDNAFNSLEKEFINNYWVDNSASSTASAYNKYAASDTNDRVFLISYSDAKNTNYKFSDNNSRLMITSDYSRAIGTYMSTLKSSYGLGHWWLRSPRADYSRDVYFIGYSGSMYFDGAVISKYGVVPAIELRLEIE